METPLVLTGSPDSIFNIHCGGKLIGTGGITDWETTDWSDCSESFSAADLSNI